MFHFLKCFFLLGFIYLSSTESKSQQLSPEQTLSILISAFQNCGPPQAFQLLGYALYQTVFVQTNGQGCYGPIRQAGPVTSMQVLSQQQFPAGPLYLVRVSHGSLLVDWFIGISQYTGRVEYLTFQGASTTTPLPDINKGPSPGGGGPGDGSGSPSGGGSGDDSDGCTLYPSMCVQ